MNCEFNLCEYALLRKPQNIDPANLKRYTVYHRPIHVRPVTSL